MSTRVSPILTSALVVSKTAVLLPHLGSATHETRNAMGMRVLENLRAWLDGKRPRDQIT